MLEKRKCGMWASNLSPLWMHDSLCTSVFVPWSISFGTTFNRPKSNLQFATGRDEHESETVTSLSPVLPQIVTNHTLKEMDQESFLWVCILQGMAIAEYKIIAHVLGFHSHHQLSNIFRAESHSLILFSIGVKHNGSTTRFLKFL